MNDDLKNGITELMLVCSRGDLAAAERLLASGADVNARDAFGHTALMYAARGGHTAVSELLLAAGADVYAKNQVKLTSMDLAQARGHAGVVQLFRKVRLFYAARDGDLVSVAEMLDAGVGVDSRYTNGWTALMTAVLYNRPDVVATLLRRGADPALQNDAGWTALLIAERKGHKYIADLLRRGRAEISWAGLPPGPLPLRPDEILPVIEASDQHEI